jgi:hypothetical protein
MALRVSWRSLPAVTVALAAATYALLLRLSTAGGLKPIRVIRDLAQTCRTPIGVGLLPNLGVLLWTAATALPLFVAFSGLAASGRWRQLLLLGGALSALLTLDDFFLLHDRYIGPTFLYLLYAALALTILVRFRDLLGQAGAGLFLAAAVFLGLSVGIDVVQDVLPLAYTQSQILEEGAKFVGIACWSAFWWRASATAAKLKTP